MAKIEKLVEQVDWFWYTSGEMSDEQVAEWKAFENGEVDEPEWVEDIEWELQRQKCGGDEIDYELKE